MIDQIDQNSYKFDKILYERRLLHSFLRASNCFMTIFNHVCHGWELVHYIKNSCRLSVQSAITALVGIVNCNVDAFWTNNRAQGQLGNSVRRSLKQAIKRCYSRSIRDGRSVRCLQKVTWRGGQHRHASKAILATSRRTPEEIFGTFLEFSRHISSSSLFASLTLEAGGGPATADTS